MVCNQHNLKLNFASKLKVGANKTICIRVLFLEKQKVLSEWILTLLRQPSAVAGPGTAAVLEVPGLLRSGDETVGRRLLGVLLGKAASLLLDPLVHRGRGHHHGAIGRSRQFAVDHLAGVLVFGEPVPETIDDLNIHHGGESVWRRKCEYHKK